VGVGVVWRRERSTRCAADVCKQARQGRFKCEFMVTIFDQTLDPNCPQFLERLMLSNADKVGWVVGILS
jgi:hypothetical protein